MKTMAIITLFFVSPISFSSNSSVKSYCDRLKIGEPFQIDNAKAVLVSKGFKVEIAIAGEAGHDTKMLTIAGSKQKCEVVVRDGNIHKIRQ